MDWLAVGKTQRISYSEREAKEMLAGFAFGVVRLTWKLREEDAKTVNGTDLAKPPAAKVRSGWAYRSFDCVPSSPYGLTMHDVAITAAVDSQVKGRAILEILAIREELDSVLASIPVTQTFWDLPVGKLGAEPPSPGDVAAWGVWRAWTLLMGLDGVKVAITHKTLHHKRPWLFPMLDSRTREALGGVNAWAAIHKDLTTQQVQFQELEDWFAARAASEHGVPLTRLRIHDILLWGGLNKVRVARMRKLGGPLVDG
jgi:hypothetical protein